ncbi:MAG: hypothetical protein H7A49_12540 [Akkermansiaceae bacterium]|nr:hypothetical protein [Akkermansiaceae bacterium]MCP5544723.1 hypothetical protein [Akkermansiaceae bacterium]MCP5545863.1 hypothetical protein [Akkermansiaceae bacterium]
MNPEQPRRSSAAQWLILLGLVALAAVWTWPKVLRQKIKADQTRAISNLRQIGLSILDFESEYGSFPDERTAGLLAPENKLGLDLTGTSSNVHFRQLIVTGPAPMEIIFYAPTGYTRKADEIMDSNDTMLAAGEVGYGYFLDGGRGMTTKDGSSGRPVACAPLAFDGHSVSTTRFDPATYDGKAVVLRADCSVTSLPIDPNTGDAILGSKPILETGPDTVWGSDGKPTILPPLPKK